MPSKPSDAGPTYITAEVVTTFGTIVKRGGDERTDTP